MGWMARCRELVEAAAALLHLDQATCEAVLTRAHLWRHVPGETMYTLLAFATYDALCELGIGEDERRIAEVYEVPRKRLLRVERKLLRLRPRQASAFLPLVTKRWDLSFREHCEVRQALHQHQGRLLSALGHAPKSLACAVAYLYLKQHRREGAPTRSMCCELVGLHESTLRTTIASVLRELGGVGALFKRTAGVGSQLQSDAMAGREETPPSPPPLHASMYGVPDQETLAYLKHPHMGGGPVQEELDASLRPPPRLPHGHRDVRPGGADRPPPV